MSRDHSVDPFSAFLDATSRRSPSGQVPSGAARSTDALPPHATRVVRALDGRPRTAVGELRAELGLSTLRIAEAVEVLRRLELVEVIPDGTDETLELTAAGRRFVEESR
ncbi:helix-turn-helix domain-containing protein [Streptomyces griseoloalbus]|uniref:Helix-turn-helix domain-containing protein n=1 Tax=Streptomyces griseoloalbus TaxID=67303 RepID=A0ABV3EAJ9_9ACTN